MHQIKVFRSFENIFIIVIIFKNKINTVAKSHCFARLPQPSAGGPCAAGCWLFAALAAWWLVLGCVSQHTLPVSLSIQLHWCFLLHLAPYWHSFPSLYCLQQLFTLSLVVFILWPWPLCWLLLSWLLGWLLPPRWPCLPPPNEDSP